MRCLSFYVLSTLAAVAAPPELVQIAPNYSVAAGGQTVVITGAEAFTGGTADYSVSFGAAVGSVVTVDGVSLSAVVPAHEAPSQVAVTVTDLRDQLSASVPAAFYFVTGPPSVVRVVDPANPTEQVPAGTTRGGKTVLVQGTGLSFTQSVKFGSISAHPDTILVLSDTEVSVVTPPSSAGLKSVGVQVAPGNLQTFTSSLYRYISAPNPGQVFPAVGASAGGTATTVFGQSLDNALSVTFGGVPATITLNTEGRIEVVVGAHTAGSVDVVVTNAYDSTTLTNAFTFYDPPVLDSISPAIGPADGGTEITLTGTNLGRLLAVRFDGVKATVKSSSDTQLVVTAPEHASGEVTVEVSTVGGADTLVYTYVAQPKISHVSPNEGSTRGDYSVTISGDALNDPTAVYFGATQALVLESSDTEVNVLAPAYGAPATVAVSVVTVGGTAIANNAFTYIRAIGIDSISPKRGYTTGGETLTILGDGFGNLQGVSVGGTPALVSSIDGVTRLVVITPAGVAGAADIVVRTLGETHTVPELFTYVDPATPFGALRGSVRNAESQAVIVRAVVVARHDGEVVGAGAADATGEYYINSLDPGDVDLEIFAPGYHRDIANAVIVAGEEESIQFSLTPYSPGGGVVSGRVDDFGNGIPLIGARIQAIHDSGIVTSYTCADGSYDLPGIPLDGSINVTVSTSASGYTSSQRSVMIGSTNVNLSLTRGRLPGLISGSVYDGRSGEAINNAQIILTPVLGSLGFGRTTNASGGFSYELLDYATYDLRVSAAGYEPHVQHVTLATTGGQHIVVNLRPPSGGGPSCAPGTSSAGQIACDIALTMVFLLVLFMRTRPIRRIPRAG